MRSRLPILLLAMLLCIAGSAMAADPKPPKDTAQPTGADPERAGPQQFLPAKTARAAKAMAVTANPHATGAAVTVLRAGGNAVDAALAAQLVLNVVEPQSSGIGGGGFMLVYHAATGRVYALDGRETAPAAMPEDWFLDKAGKPIKFYPHRITGGRAVGVPGLLAMLELARQRFGGKDWVGLSAPAIALARQGFPVSSRLAASLERHKERLGQFPATRKVFFDASGAPLQAGATVRQQELAATLELLASQGVDPFYRGAPARAMVESVRENPVSPGLLTMEDMAAYRAVEREPVRFTYRSHTLLGMGPPSSGAVTAFQMLALLEHAPPRASLAQDVHHFAWAAALAYADRGRYLADADFAQVPVEGMLHPDYLKTRAGAIQWSAPLHKVEPGSPPGAATARLGTDAHPEAPGTTHLVVADAHGNVVSLTSSIEQAFGSGMVVPGLGFFLNNQLSDFSPRPRDAEGRPIANRVRGGKRPRSSMAPTIVLKDGKPVLALGSPGGSRIIQYVAQVLWRVLAHGNALPEAVQNPLHTHLGGRTDLEPPLDGNGLPDALRALGHEVRVRPQGSGLHAVQIGPGGLLGVADPRREGTAAGF